MSNNFLQVVSILSNWTSSEKIKLDDFERDPRFLRLCKILTRNNSGPKQSRTVTVPTKSEDLTTVLSVTADEEAAKLVESITLPQMVKVSYIIIY